MVCDLLFGLYEVVGMVLDCCGGGLDLVWLRNLVYCVGVRFEVFEFGEERGEKIEVGFVLWELVLWVDVVFYFWFYDYVYEELFLGLFEVGFV